MLMPFLAQTSQTTRPVANCFGPNRRHPARDFGRSPTSGRQERPGNPSNTPDETDYQNSAAAQLRPKPPSLPHRSVFGPTNGAPSSDTVKKRKIVEHIILLRAKPNISDAEEKDMLDYLYTSQYQTRGILTVSLGRIEGPNSESFTHAVFMRFQQKEDIAKFQSSSYYSKVLDEHVKPVSYGLVSVDFESEVEDDIIPLFRRGEDFNYGVEFMLLMSFLETASRESVEGALAHLQKLIIHYSSFIVQATSGCCLDHMDSLYSHAAVIRFPSIDDFKLFKESTEYKDMWTSKFHPFTERCLELHFVVDPVGNQLM